MLTDLTLGLSYKYFHDTKANMTVIHDASALRAYNTALQVMEWDARDFGTRILV